MAKGKPAAVTPSQVRLLNNLRALMAAAKNADQTQGTIARAAGLSPPYLSLILRGRRSLSLDVIEALAPVLGTTADAILRQDNPASASRVPLSASRDPLIDLFAAVLRLQEIVMEQGRAITALGKVATRPEKVATPQNIEQSE